MNDKYEQEKAAREAKRPEEFHGSDAKNLKRHARIPMEIQLEAIGFPGVLAGIAHKENYDDEEDREEVMAGARGEDSFVLEDRDHDHEEEYGGFWLRLRGD